MHKTLPIRFVLWNLAFAFNPDPRLLLDTTSDMGQLKEQYGVLVSESVTSFSSTPFFKQKPKGCCLKIPENKNRRRTILGRSSEHSPHLWIDRPKKGTTHHQHHLSPLLSTAEHRPPQMISSVSGPKPPASNDSPQSWWGRRSIWQVAVSRCAFPYVVSTPVSFCPTVTRKLFKTLQNEDR